MMSVDRIATVEPMQTELNGFELLVLIAQLQLALRHPGNNGAAARTANLLARRFQAYLSNARPELSDLLEAGWDASRDVPTQAARSETWACPNCGRDLSDEEDFCPYCAQGMQWGETP